MIRAIIVIVAVAFIVQFLTSVYAQEPERPTLELAPYHIHPGEQAVISVRNCPGDCTIFVESPQGSGTSWGTRLFQPSTDVIFSPNSGHCGTWPREGVWPVRLFDSREYFNAGDDTVPDALASGVLWVEC